MNIYGFPLNAYLNKVTVRSDRLRTVLVVYVNGQRWSAQTCIACSAPIRKKRRVLFSMPSSLFVPFPLRCVLSLQSPGQGTCVDQVRWPSSLEEPHVGASSLLCMAELRCFLLSPSAPSPHCEDLGSLP